MYCKFCNKELSGRQIMFCCRKCKNSFSNGAVKQKSKGIAVKRALIDSLGGECTVCGYKKNLASLVFHHDGKGKDFPITTRECANKSQATLLKEVARCILLCHNCHMELHYPDYSMVAALGIEPSAPSI